jgi:hypothetical protein
VTAARVRVGAKLELVDLYVLQHARELLNELYCFFMAVYVFRRLELIAQLRQQIGESKLLDRDHPGTLCTGIKWGWIFETHAHNTERTMTEDMQSRVVNIRNVSFSCPERLSMSDTRNYQCR